MFRPLLAPSDPSSSRTLGPGRIRAKKSMRAILYTWSSCSFCQRAKELLEAKRIDYREVVLDGRKDELRRLQESFGKCTVPLVLLDGEMIAGLEALERRVREDDLA